MSDTPTNSPGPKKPCYLAHLFICTNSRDDGRECCASKHSEELRRKVKAIVRADPELRAITRVNASGCLDQCKNGITAVLYPKGKWLLHLTVNDEEMLVREIRESLGLTTVK